MSRKRKKVATGFNKQNQAHQKNEFKRKVVAIAKCLVPDYAQQLLTDKVLEEIYMSRFRPVKIECENCTEFNSGEIEDMRRFILKFLHHNYFDEDPCFKEINLYDLITAGFSLHNYLTRLNKRQIDGKSELLTHFLPFIIEGYEFLSQMLWHLLHASNIIAWDLSEFDKTLYHIKIDIKTETDTNFTHQYPLVQICKVLAETCQVSIDGNVRPVFRVGYSNIGKGFTWAGLKASELGLTPGDADTPVPVYIQRHALERLRERLDTLPYPLLVFSIMHSLEHKKTVIRYKQHYLIAMYYLEQKVGYLKIELIDGIAVIQTFLFLTHSATPEGDRLNSIIGLEKPDIQYLNLDRLSTFAQSGLRENSTLCGLFEKAGCRSLLEIDKNSFDLECSVLNVAKIEAYIKKREDYLEDSRKESGIRYREMFMEENG